MRTLILLFCWCFIFNLSQAQEFGAAIVVGANFSQVDGDQLGGYNKLGLCSGIAITRKIEGPWIGSFEILYSQKGSKKVIDPDVITPSLKLSYHYVEVPVLARYQFNNKIQFLAGPSLGVNVFNERDDNGIITQEDALKNTEVALHLGGGYAIGEKLSLELRHVYSLFTIRDQQIIVLGPTWFGRAGWYNRLFSIQARYTFR